MKFEVAPERLSDQDAQILRLEAGAIRGHTAKVLIVDPPPSGPSLGLGELRDRVATRLDRLPRLRQRLATPALGIGNPVWVDDEEFDLERHVCAAPAEGPVDEPGLRAVVAGLMATRLPRERPLWRADLVELDGGGSAVVVRIHHCMADGITALRVLSAILLDPDSGPSGSAQPGSRLAAPPSASPRSPRALLAEAIRVPAVLARELSRRGSASPLAARVGDRRSVAFASAPLDEVRRLGKAFGPGVTVNDVVLAAVGGGLRRWLEHRHSALSGLRVQVPVSLHHHDERPDELGNHDSFMFVDLPLAEPDPVDRLLAINAETSERKRHHDAQVLDAFFHDLAHVSHSLERLGERWAMDPRVFALNVSNVPGPPGPLFVLGAPVRELYSLAEIADRHALRASVVSAGGKLAFSLCADAEVVDDLHVVADGISEEIEALRARASG